MSPRAVDEPLMLAGEQGGRSRAFRVLEANLAELMVRVERLGRRSERPGTHTHFGQVAVTALARCRPLDRRSP